MSHQNFEKMIPTITAELDSKLDALREYVWVDDFRNGLGIKKVSMVIVALVRFDSSAVQLDGGEKEGLIVDLTVSHSFKAIFECCSVGKAILCEKLGDQRV